MEINEAIKSTKMKNLTYTLQNIFLLLSISLISTLPSCKNQQESSDKTQEEKVSENTVEDSLKPTESFIKAPCNGIDIPYESYEIIGGRNGEINYKPGSKIKFKPNSFVDKNGKPVEGEITVLYREFHNPVDFFISGIPMHYDTLGERKHFESAGMLDILAFKDGEPVFINPKSPLKIEMKSQYEGTDYNLYYLDTAARGWQYMGKDKVTTLAENKSANKNITLSENEAKPIEPKMANKLKHRFNMDVDLKQFPELNTYKGVIFELSDVNTTFDPKLYKVTWDDAELSESKIKGSYNLKLFKEDTSFTFVVCPAFEGSNYDKAMLDFKSKMTVYNNQLAIRKKQENKAETASNTTVNSNADFSAFMPDNKTTKDITRAFEINKFGVWNCDKFKDMPNGEEVIGEYTDAEGKPLDFVSLFFVDKKRNSLFNITGAKKWTYNPRSENLLWGVLRDNRVAVFSPSKFRKIKRSEGKCHFTMSASDNVSALKEIKQFIGL